ncbi:Ti-type conjugative transfer relaxase TraA [Alphaproteobacteria bacterium]|nr:Ti-type conjugative transfer relaxase TraA [Alphaproteobacteria bacterium]
MAIFHLRTKIIGRSSHNTVSAVAYRGGVELSNDETGEVFDYSKKAVAEVELLLSEKAPSWAKDIQDEIAKDRGDGLQKLVDVVESFEKRKDAQVWREVEFSLPRELSNKQGLELAREYLSDQFCREGMGVLLNAHMDVDAVTGDRKPHVHALIFMREMTEEGFGKKVRTWNDRGLHESWREQLAAYTNFHLKMHGIDQRIDHRSYAERGIDIIPQPKLGKNVVEMERRDGRSVHTPLDAAVTDKGRAYQSDYLKNVYKVVSNPEVLFDIVTSKQSTFVWSDVQKALHRYVDDPALFQKLDQKLQLSPELVVLNGGGDKPLVFTTKSYAENERSLETVSRILGERTSHTVGEGVLSSVVDKTDRELRTSFGTGLSDDQKGALSHMCSSDQISCVVGYAGAGKTTVLLAAKEAYEKSGYRVYGLAPTGKAAQNLEGEGLSSETLFKFLRDFEAGRSQYAPKSVIVLDEGGMVPVSQMKDFLSAVNTLGVKAVIVGDGAQLQPIEAGAAFRKVAEQVGSFKLEHVVRQKEEWQREATKAFGRQESAVALQAYAEKGCISIVSGKEGLSGTVLAKQQMLEDWKSSVQSDKSSLMMASSRAEVSSLNEMARHHLQREGLVEKESYVHKVSRPISDDFGRYIKDAAVEERAFAKGDQIIFLRNDRSLGVKNGNLATITTIDRNKIEAQLLGVKGEDGKPQSVSFATNLYNAIDYGWASTIHKNQGSTVDRSFYLASTKDSRNLYYVAMSRHRESVQVYGSREEFKNEQGLIKSLSQSNEKLLASDYVSCENMSDLYREDRALLSKSFETLENHWTAMKFVGTEKIQELKEQYLGNPRLEKENIDIRSYFKDREGERARDILNLDMPSQEGSASIEKGAEPTKSSFRERIDLDRINDCLKAEARTVASSLLGEPNKALSSSKEFRYGAKGSLCVSVSGRASGQWFDFEKGDGGNLFTLIQQTKGTDFKETLQIADDLTQGRARDLVPVTSQDSKPKEPSLAESQERQEKIEKAQRLYEKTSPCVEGTYAEAYLDVYRKIRTYPGDDVRSGTAYDKRTNQEYNTLVAFARNAQGEITGGQTIYLNEKAKKADIDVNKRSFGVIKGSVVTLQEDENKTGRTFMAEGVETALSIKESEFEGKIIATLGIHNFKNYEPSETEKQVIICADNDGESSPSLKIVDQAQERFKSLGLDSFIVTPAQEGRDINDILRIGGVSAVEKLLAEKSLYASVSLPTIDQINKTEETNYAQELRYMSDSYLAMVMRNCLSSMDKTARSDDVSPEKERLLGYISALQENSKYSSFNDSYPKLLKEAEAAVGKEKSLERELDKGRGMDM